MRVVSVCSSDCSLKMRNCSASVARGFTLIEIMVVVVILGILAALVAPNVMRRIDDAQIAKVKQDIRVVRDRAQPVPHGQLQVPDHRPGTGSAGDTAQRPIDPQLAPGGYLQGGLRKDPWGNDYHYVNPGSARRVRSVHARRRQTRKAAKASTPTSATGMSNDRQT